MATLADCKRLALMIEPEAFFDLSIHNKEWLYYRSMLLFLYGTLNGIHDVAGLRTATKFKTSTIKTVCKNLSENGIWKDGIAYVDLDEGEAWMEIVLCTMCAMGQLGRQEVSSYPVPALPLQMIPALQELERRLLNDTLEEITLNQLYRENKPYEFQIPKDIFDAQ